MIGSIPPPALAAQVIYESEEIRNQLWKNKII